MGECIIEETEDQLNYTFILSRYHIKDLHTSLSDYQGDIKDLLRLQFILTDNIEVKQNHKKSTLNFETTSKDKDLIILKYSSKKEEKVTSFTIQNKGLNFLTSGHTSFDFWLKLNDQKRLFKFTDKHKTIKAEYK